LIKALTGHEPTLVKRRDGAVVLKLTRRHLENLMKYAEIHQEAEKWLQKPTNPLDSPPQTATAHAHSALLHAIRDGGAPTFSPRLKDRERRRRTRQRTEKPSHPAANATKPPIGRQSPKNRRDADTRQQTTHNPSTSDKPKTTTSHNVVHPDSRSAGNPRRLRPPEPSPRCLNTNR